MKQLFFLLLFLVFFMLNSLLAQNGSEIYLADIRLDETSAELSNIKNISNHNGYDNQPYFWPGTDKILFSSIRDNKQSDIYEYDIQSEKLSPFIISEESEYSPTLAFDKNSIICVRVEKDEAQRLWAFDIKKKTPRLFLPNVDSVGYYTFLSKEKIALFILGEPQTLRMVDIKLQIETVIDKNIGRTLQVHPINRQLYYVDKNNHDKWYLKTLKNNSIITVVEMPSETEDFCFTSDGLILAFSNNKLLAYYPEESRSWFVLSELNDFMNKKITRIAINQTGNKIAFVVAE